MTRVLADIEQAELADASKLLLDFVAEPESPIQGFLKRGAGSDDPWREAIRQSSRAESEAGWVAVVDEIEALGSRIGARADVLARLEGARRRETCFIVTGQQPGALGGPLHTAYKAATAVALAEMVERRFDRPCVPLYWIGADDSDFQEVRPLHLWTDQLSPVSTSIAQKAHASGQPVGDVGIDALARVFADVKPFLRPFPGGDYITEVIESSMEVARDHGELSAAILTGLFGGSILAVDGRSRAVRRQCQPLMERFIAEVEQVKLSVDVAGRRLRQLGYHSQLAVGAELGVFIMEDGLRKSVPAGEVDVLAATAATRPEDIAPGVVMRNLIQDHTFRPLATVLGPAELAYRAQITSLYAQFSVSCPIATPRLSATFVPPELADIMRRREGDLLTLVENPAEFAHDTYRASLPRPLRQAADRFKDGVDGLVEGFLREHLEQFPGRARGRITGRFKEVSRRADSAVDAVIEGGKTAALEKWPFLADLPDLIRPGHKRQERSLSLLVPFLFEGPDMAQSLGKLAVRHLDHLVDDNMKHIVYSTQS